MISPHDLIRAYGQRTSRALGQHFLHNAVALRDIVAAAKLGPDDLALEIGPGPGVLTSALLSTGARVVAVEKDRRAVEFLRGDFMALLGPNPALTVVGDDALTVDLGALLGAPGRPPVAVGNLPYNIGTALVLRLLHSPLGFSRMVFMLQKEVALRLAAPPGSGDYGSLSLAAQARAHVELLFDVGPESFSPPPKVTSSVLRLVPAEVVPVGLLGSFELVVRAAFQARRKTIRNSLQGGLRAKKDEVEALLGAASIEGERRAETVSLAEYVKLAEAWEASLRPRG
jgi:16S rRNA (adenine1518-N6/adenine1519-N6)-dimethyltransferase